MSSPRSSRDRRKTDNPKKTNSNTTASSVPNFSNPSSSPSSSAATGIGAIRATQWHQQPGTSRLFGKSAHNPELTQSLLFTPSDVRLNVDEEKKSLDERTQNAVFSRAHEIKISRNSRSNNLIIRTLRNQHKRKAIMLAINLLSIVIIYGVTKQQLNSAYSEEQDGIAKESMIALNAIAITFDYWIKALGWLNVLHVFYGIYQDANTPDLVEKADMIYEGLQLVDEKLDDVNDALKLFGAETPLRKAIESLATPGSTPLEKATDHIVKEVSERVEQARDDIEALTTKVDSVQNTVNTQKEIEATKAKTLFKRNYTRVGNILDKTSKLTDVIASIRAGFTKETTSGLQTIDSVEEKPTQANHWDVVYLVAQVLSLFDDVEEINEDTCKTAMDILLNIREKLSEENTPAKVSLMKDIFEQAKHLDATAHKSIFEPNQLIEYVVEAAKPQPEELEEEKFEANSLRNRGV